MSVKRLVRGLPRNEQDVVHTYWRILRVLNELHHDEPTAQLPQVASRLTVAASIEGLRPDSPSTLIVPPEYKEV
jgi:hypothetical protein